MPYMRVLSTPGISHVVGSGKHCSDLKQYIIKGVDVHLLPANNIYLFGLVLLDLYFTKEELSQNLIFPSTKIKKPMLDQEKVGTIIGHPKSRKTRTTYSDLRLVPRNLIASFPSLNLNPANKVCSTVCCRKLYALCGSHTLDSQDSHVTLDAVHQIPEDQPAVSASVSSDDLSAPLDTDVRCEASMEVNPETNVEQMEVGLNPAHPILAQGGDEVNPRVS
ncbi:hypothetical protein EMCRGX_G033568 [Ephydatia muelleri]